MHIHLKTALDVVQLIHCNKHNITILTVYFYTQLYPTIGFWHLMPSQLWLSGWNKINQITNEHLSKSSWYSLFMLGKEWVKWSWMNQDCRNEKGCIPGSRPSIWRYNLESKSRNTEKTQHSDLFQFIVEGLTGLDELAFLHLVPLLYLVQLRFQFLLQP